MNTLTLRAALALLAPLGLLAALCPPAPCQWGSTPEDPLPICTGQPGLEYPLITRLSSGRYIIVWADSRNGTNNAFYQMLDSYGVALLETNGRKVVPNSTWLTGAAYLLPDSQGGCICVFYDDRNGAGNYDIYGQRFDSLGNKLWGETGLPLILWPGTEDVLLKDAVVDSYGSLFLAWVRDMGLINQIYVQKVNLAGERLWGDYGIMDCGNINNCDYQQMTYDNQGGAIDVWVNDPEITYLFAQHMNSNGAMLWAANGLPLLSPTGPQLQMMLGEAFPDGSGGAICIGNSGGVPASVPKAFRVSGSNGSVLWYWVWVHSTDRVFVDAIQHPTDLNIYALTCTAYTPAPQQSYLLRFNLLGTPLFGGSGIPVQNVGAAYRLVETSDGVIVVGRNLQGNLLTAQRYDSTGQTIWGLQGFPLAYSPQTLSGEPELCSDGSDGLVAVWEDARNWPGNGMDLYAAYMRADGSLGNVMPPPPFAPEYTQHQLYLRGNTVVFTLPKASEIRLELYDLLGRHAATLAQGVYPAG